MIVSFFAAWRALGFFGYGQAQMMLAPVLV